MKRTPNNDEPDINISLLTQRQGLLTKLVEDILECPPPMVFGIHGDWGAGKTSFLQAVMKALTGSCPSSPGPLSENELADHPEWESDDAPVAVWFEAWRYQNESAPIVALLHEIRAQLSVWTQTKNKVKTFGETALLGFRLALDTITLKIESEAVPHVLKASAQVNPLPVSKAYEEVKKARFLTPLPANQIREALDAAFQGLLGEKPSKAKKPRRRIVVFIDDLDRCSAAAMFSLLESIKIYLNLKHCVFVLGINRHELERNISSMLGEQLTSEQRHLRAHEYLEKLCGNVIRLPYPSAEGQAKLVNKWLGCIDNFLRKEIVRLVSDHNFLPLNPRRVKMWCNTVLQMLEQRYRQLSADPDITELSALTLVATLHTFYPTLHQALVASPSFILALQQWSQAERLMKPELDVFDGLMRIFVAPSFIRDELKTPDSIQNILKRAYGWRAGPTDDKESEVPKAERIPLLTDPSSLQYFHPQYLVADASITEDDIKPYLHIIP